MNDTEFDAALNEIVESEDASSLRLAEPMEHATPALDELKPKPIDILAGVKADAVTEAALSEWRIAALAYGSAALFVPNDGSDPRVVLPSEMEALPKPIDEMTLADYRRGVAKLMKRIAV